MGIFELLSFDFGEFIQSPASIFIIAGCIFLAIGIVLYIMGDKKKGTEVEANNETKTEIEETKEVKVETAVEAPVEEAPVVIKNETETVSEAPVVEAAPVAETINFDSVTSVAESAVPVETLDAPVVAPVVDTSSIVKPEEPAVETLDSPKAYGGANPSATGEIVAEEKPREIYGGANPLENTAPIPAETVREAYAGAQLNVTPAVVAPEPTVAPVVEEKVEVVPIAEAPVVAPVEAAPAVETKVEAPVVEEAPVAEPAPTQPVEEVEKLEF